MFCHNFKKSEGVGPVYFSFYSLRLVRGVSPLGPGHQEAGVGTMSVIGPLPMGVEPYVFPGRFPGTVLYLVLSTAMQGHSPTLQLEELRYRLATCSGAKAIQVGGHLLLF